MATHVETRPDKAKPHPAKETKSQRMARVVEKSMAKPPEKAQEIRKTDAGEKPKIKKKLSQTVLDWRALSKEFPEGKAKIKLLVPKEKAKRGAALKRFELYKDGMTVDEYIELSVKNGHTRGGAREDIRWDYTKKLIDVK